MNKQILLLFGLGVFLISCQTSRTEKDLGNRKPAEVNCGMNLNFSQQAAQLGQLSQRIEIQNGWRVKQLETRPTRVSTTEISYSFPFPNEVKLEPNEAIYFMIPEALQQRQVSFVIVGHRQPLDHRGWNPQTQRDDIPGITSMLVHPKGAPENEWRYWAGPSSGAYGGKYAEPRSRPEMDNLYDWFSVGHRSILPNSQRSTQPLSIDAARLVNVGRDEVLVGSYSVKFAPDRASMYLEKIFTERTSFNDIPGAKGRFGGGQSFRGLFPNALPLNSSRASSTWFDPNHPLNMRLLRNDLLEIDLPPDHELVSVEIAAGDSHPDQITNSDRGWGTQGGAKFSVGIGQNPQNIQAFIRDENVPPEGLLFGSPDSCFNQIKQGDKLYISARSDIFYIMGLRIGLNPQP